MLLKVHFQAHAWHGEAHTVTAKQGTFKEARILGLGLRCKAQRALMKSIRTSLQVIFFSFWFLTLFFPPPISSSFFLAFYFISFLPPFSCFVFPYLFFLNFFFPFVSSFFLTPLFALLFFFPQFYSFFCFSVYLYHMLSI